MKIKHNDGNLYAKVEFELGGKTGLPSLGDLIAYLFQSPHGPQTALSELVWVGYLAKHPHNKAE